MVKVVGLSIYNIGEVSLQEDVKALCNGLYGCQISEKQHSWSSRLLGITNSLEMKGVCPIHI